MRPLPARMSPLTRETSVTENFVLKWSPLPRETAAANPCIQASAGQLEPGRLPLGAREPLYTGQRWTLRACTPPPAPAPAPTPSLLSALAGSMVLQPILHIVYFLDISFDLNSGAECAQSVFRTTQNSNIKHWAHFYKIPVNLMDFVFVFRIWHLCTPSSRH